MTCQHCLTVALRRFPWMLMVLKTRIKVFQSAWLIMLGYDVLIREEYRRVLKENKGVPHDTR